MRMYSVDEGCSARVEMVKGRNGGCDENWDEGRVTRIAVP